MNSLRAVEPLWNKVYPIPVHTKVMPWQPCMFYVICRFTKAQFSREKKTWSFLFTELWLI